MNATHPTVPDADSVCVCVFVRVLKVFGGEDVIGVESSVREESVKCGEQESRQTYL